MGSPVVPLVNSSTATASGSQPHPSVSATDSSTAASRKLHRSRTSMPPTPAKRSATPRPAMTTAGAQQGDDGAEAVVGQPVVDRHEGLAGRSLRRRGRRARPASSRRSAPRSHRAPRRAASRPGGRGGRARRRSCPLDRSDGGTVTEVVGRHLQDHPDVHVELQSEEGSGLAPFSCGRSSATERLPCRSSCTGARDPRPR